MHPVCFLSEERTRPWPGLPSPPGGSVSVIWTILVLHFHGGGPYADPHLGLGPLCQVPCGMGGVRRWDKTVVVSMHSGCPHLPPSLLFPCCMPISFPIFETELTARMSEKCPLERGLFTDHLKYRLSAGQSVWASPPSPACTQKLSRARAPPCIAPLCAQGVPFQEEQICTLSR